MHKIKLLIYVSTLLIYLSGRLKNFHSIAHDHHPYFSAMAYFTYLARFHDPVFSFVQCFTENKPSKVMD